MNKKLYNYTLLYFVIPLLWGSTFLGTKICIEQMGPLWMGTLRYFLASLFFTAVLLRKRDISEWKPDISMNWALYLGAGGLGVFSATFCQNIGQLYTTAAAASLISTLEPVMVIVLSVIILKERLSVPMLIGILISLAGVLLIVSNGDLSIFSKMEISELKGNVLLSLSMLFYGFYTVFSKTIVSRSEPLRAVTIACITGTVFLLASALSMEKMPDFGAYSAKTYAALFYMAFFPTCLALFLCNKLLVEIEASKMSIVLFLMPIYGVILGIIFLGESVSGIAIGGGCITLLGTYLMEKKHT